MRVRVYPDAALMSVAAATHAASIINKAIAERGSARVVAATAASQFRFLAALTVTRDIDWSRVELFHLDEYIGLPMTHRASFRGMVMEHIVSKTGIERYHLLDAETNPAATCRAVGKELTRDRVDVLFAGIGENAHLAFNDPPADFTTTEPYIIVKLDEACRRQQVGEGWFATLDAVPTRAVSMSIRQILSADAILAIVPDARKAAAVKATLEGPVSPAVPASILTTHPNVTLYLDEAAARQLTLATRARYAG